MLHKSFLLDWLVFVVDVIDAISEIMKNWILLSAVPLEIPDENWMASLRLIYKEHFLLMLTTNLMIIRFPFSLF